MSDKGLFLTENVSWAPFPASVYSLLLESKSTFYNSWVKLQHELKHILPHVIVIQECCNKSL